MDEDFNTLDNIIEKVAEVDPVFYEQHLRNFNVQDLTERILSKEFLRGRYEFTIDSKDKNSFIMIYSTVTANTESTSCHSNDLFITICLTYLLFMVREIEGGDNIS